MGDAHYRLPFDAAIFTMAVLRHGYVTRCDTHTHAEYGSLPEETLMASMTPEAREAFLAQARLGFFATLSADGAPVCIPIWFEWDGHCARMFTGESSPKIRRLQRDARASLVVASTFGEKEEWVSIEGAVTIHLEGGFGLAERMAPRYWDLNDPARAQTLKTWRDQASSLRLLELIPSKIRSYT